LNRKKLFGFLAITIIVATISLLISKYEGVMLSTGTLIMNSVNYKVLLTSPALASGIGEMI
jgi:hypothetical protein